MKNATWLIHKNAFTSYTVDSLIFILKLLSTYLIKFKKNSATIIIYLTIYNVGDVAFAIKNIKAKIID